MPDAAREYEFDDDPARIDLDALWAFLSEHAYWGRQRTRELVEAQAKSAWRVIGCYRRDSGRMVGFARAFSDGATAYLADVYIEHAARGHGLGVRLVHTMIEDGPGRGLRWLLHTDDAHELYHRFGFTGADGTYLERPRRLPSGPPRAAAGTAGAVDASAPLHRAFDARVLVRLGAALDAAVPAPLRVECRLPIDLGRGATATPDLAVFTPDSTDDPARTHRPARDVVLAVHIDSSPGRGPAHAAAPPHYAAAGVPHVWQVGRERGRPVVHTFALDPGTGRYREPVALHDRLTAAAPVAVDVDVHSLFS